MNDNVKPIVLELIELKTKLDPLIAKFDSAKERIREVGPDTYPIPGVGKVVVSAPVEKKVKGSELVIDHEKLEQADPELKARLFALGIVRTEIAYTRASKSKVEVKLEAASAVGRPAFEHSALAFSNIITDGPAPAAADVALPITEFISPSLGAHHSAGPIFCARKEPSCKRRSPPSSLPLQSSSRSQQSSPSTCRYRTGWRPRTKRPKRIRNRREPGHVLHDQRHVR